MQPAQSKAFEVDKVCEDEGPNPNQDALEQVSKVALHLHPFPMNPLLQFFCRLLHSCTFNSWLLLLS